MTIARRFNGPPESGNGGYVSGLLAQHFEQEFGEVPESANVQVTLRKPPPLETDLGVRRPPESDTLRLMNGSLLIAEAEMVEADPDGIVEPVSLDEAVAAAKSYVGLTDHPFPECFVCGPSHPTGLHIYPGWVDGRPDTVAAPWIPEDIGPEFVWAALDCPGGWAPGGLATRPMVLGRMSAHVSGLPEIGAPCILVGRHVRTEGRKSFTASTLYGPDGEVLGHAEAVWIAVDPTTVRPA